MRPADDPRRRQQAFDLYLRLVNGEVSAEALSPAEEALCRAGLTEQRLLAASGRRTAEEARLLRQVAELLPPARTEELQGLTVSPHPAGRLQLLRFFEISREHPWPGLGAPGERWPFWELDLDGARLGVAFADPLELHYRTFENILPLDPLFPPDLPRIVLRGRARGRGVHTFAAAGAEGLLRLDGLGLYLPPLHPGYRGGRRFIFHAAALGVALTEAVRASMPRDLLRGFSHVNPVFRYNRFEPGDEPFHAHHDSPYYDASRRHASRYTLLLYLTGGSGDPALQIGDMVFRSLDAMSCVIFEQSREHRGEPYTDGPKLFLRSELIFRDAGLAHDPRISALFAKACYFTGESLLFPELRRYTADCYERAAAARWRGLEPGPPAAPVLRKTFRDARFVSDGFDYWFPKGSLSLIDCAALAILDNLNCRVGGSSFRSLCSAEVIEGPGDSAWIEDLLAEGGPPPEPPLGRLGKEALFPPPEEEDPGVCCPDHEENASRNRRIVHQYWSAQRLARVFTLPAPILALGQEIFLDEGRFRIQGNQIFALSREAPAPVHFAGGTCWPYTAPEDYLGVDVTLDAPFLLVPPILFRETARGYQLTLDLFRNSWMVAHHPRAVPVPKITEQAGDEGSLWEAAAAHLREEAEIGARRR